MTKFYGLVALAVGAIWLSPASAQSEPEWLACMDITGGDEAACAHLLPPPPPPPEEEPQPPPPPPPQPQPQPQPDGCAKGNQGGGHGYGHANSNRCNGGPGNHHGRPDYRAKAKAAYLQFVRWCNSWFSHHGRR